MRVLSIKCPYEKSLETYLMILVTGLLKDEWINIIFIDIWLYFHSKKNILLNSFLK